MHYPALIGALTAALLLGTPRYGYTVCDPEIIRSSHPASDEAWQACNCAEAKSARAFRRCYRAFVLSRGAQQGLTGDCLEAFLKSSSEKPTFPATCGRRHAVVCCYAKRIFGGYTEELCSVKASASLCVGGPSKRACISRGQQNCGSSGGLLPNCTCTGLD